MRIGIHIGTIITGVTGSNIVRFDLYGIDVKIANKIESEGVKNKVNVSTVARKYIDEAEEGQYVYKYNKKAKTYAKKGGCKTDLSIDT